MNTRMSGGSTTYRIGGYSGRPSHEVRHRRAPAGGHRRRRSARRELQGAEKNDSSAWLPAKAESTQALNLQAHFVSKNIFPAVVTYQRPSGLTQADRAKAASDARGFAAVTGAGGRVARPVPSRDG